MTGKFMKVYVCFIPLMVFLSACSQADSSATAMSTGSQPQSTSTIMVVPTSSETSIPTIIPFPSPTALVPTPNANGQYLLADWTPEKAEKLIAILDEYPETLSYVDQGYLGVGRYIAFRYAALARAEAVFRFPNDPQNDQWQWEEAYNRIQSEFGGAGNIYASLIIRKLNQGQTTISDLSSWFEGHEPRLQLETAPVTRPKNYDNSYITSISSRDSDLSGGFYLWLLKNQFGYVAYPLESRYDFYLVDGEHGMDLQDLTGDSIPEAIVRHVDWHSFNLHSGALDVFNISQVPPKRISFNPSPPDIETADWSILKDGNQVVGVSLQIPVDMTSGGCSRFGPTWHYRWNGDIFDLVSLQSPDIKELMENTQCADRLISYFSWLIRQDYLPAKEELKQLLGLFPFSPGADIGIRDEYRFRFGLQLARNGDVKEAQEQFRIIATQPATSTSPWQQTANQFLAHYNSETDLFEVCLAVMKCYPHLAINTLADLIPGNRYSELPALLGQMGVPMVNSGLYDFNADRQNETWLLEYQFPGSYHDFWIFSLAQDEIRSERLVDVRADAEVQNLIILPLASVQNIPVFQISVGNEEDFRNVFLYWSDNMPIKPIDEDEAVQELNKITSELLSGNSTPEFALSRLIALQNTPVTCGYASVGQCLVNPRLEYMIGLAHELRGDVESAKISFLQLWQRYPDNPYAIMASAKLEYQP